MTPRRTLSAIAAGAAASSAATAALFSALPAPAAVAPSSGPRAPSIAALYGREARTAREVDAIAADVDTLKARSAATGRLVARIDEKVAGGSRVSFGRSPYDLLVGLYSACVNNEDCRVGP